jgi:hypothetical protein
MNLVGKSKISTGEMPNKMERTIKESPLLRLRNRLLEWGIAPLLSRDNVPSQQTTELQHLPALNPFQQVRPTHPKPELEKELLP